MLCKYQTLYDHKMADVLMNSCGGLVDSRFLKMSIIYYELICLQLKFDLPHVFIDTHYIKTDERAVNVFKVIT